MTIYYHCPDLLFKSAGFRIIYRHVDVLVRHGIKASVLHFVRGFKMPDMPEVPVAHADGPFSFSEGDIVVVPEGFAGLFKSVKQPRIRQIVMALNWDYAYSFEREPQWNWRSSGIERILSHSPFICDFLRWSTRLPAHQFIWGINPKLYYPQEQKALEVVWLERKQTRLLALRNILTDRDPRFGTLLRWTPLHDLSEADYAAVIRRAALFLNLSSAEGLPCSLLEAMRCKTFVAGYDSVGGQRELIGSGPMQNCILSGTMDYATLAGRLEPLLLDLLKGDVSRHMPIINNALATSRIYDWDAEEKSILALWRELLQ